MSAALTVIHVVEVEAAGAAAEPIDVGQVIYALVRQENICREIADRLAAEFDYSAELWAEDAERLREARALIAWVRQRGVVA